MGEYDADLRIFPDEFVPNVQASKVYQRWAKSSPGDRGRWEAFRDALLAGQEPSVPSMSTSFGRALVAAGKEHMSISQLVGLPTPPYPPPGTPPAPSVSPQPPNGWGGPLTITSGGVYDGTITGQGWSASSPGAAAITVATNEPVTIRGWARNLNGGGGAVVDALQAGTQLTLDNLAIYGKFIVPNNETPNRAAWVEGFSSFVVRNCHLENTSGIEVNSPASGATVLIEKTRCKNIQGYINNLTGVVQVGNFIQFRYCRNHSSAIVRWNEILADQDKAFAEDQISCYATRAIQVTDNWFGHHAQPFNVVLGKSSQGGLTAEGEGAFVVSDMYFARNHFVDGHGIYIWTTNGGSNNLAENNRVISDRFLPDGTIKANGEGVPMALPLISGTNNHMHNNYVAWIDKDGWGVVGNPGDYDLADVLKGAAEGGAAEALNNTWDTPTAAMELVEWNTWQNKLVANGIAVGMA